jgi:hypothetical protein
MFFFFCKQSEVTFDSDGNVKFQNPLYAAVVASEADQQEPYGSVPNSPPGYNEMEVPDNNYLQTFGKY